MHYTTDAVDGTPGSAGIPAGVRQVAGKMPALPGPPGSCVQRAKNIFGAASPWVG